MPPHPLRLTQHPNLPVARCITRHEQSPLRIPRQARRPKAPRAETRSITLAFLYSRVVKDVLGRCGTSKRLNRSVVAVRTNLELHSDELEAGDGCAVPATVVSNVHGRTIGVELAVDGCRVREQRKLGSCGCLDAGIVVHVGAGLLDKPIAYFEGLVGEVAGLPDGETGRVAVPVVVGLGHVSHVMDLLAWVVEVNIFSVALEVVAAVLYAPEPVALLVLSRALIQARLTCCSCRNRFRRRYADRSQRCILRTRSCSLRLESLTDRRP